MNDLVLLHGGVALTSAIAIAEGTENEHASVLKTVRLYMSDFESFGNLRFEIANQAGKGGRPTEYAMLNEQQATLLLTYMRNSEVIRKFKRKLVHAFFEMAKIVNQPSASSAVQMLNDPATMRGLLLTYSEKVIELEAENQEMRPAVLAFNRIDDADGSMTLREAAKALQHPERRLHQFMHEKNWLYRGPKGGWLGYAAKTKAGHLTHKVSTYLDEVTQETKVSHKVRVTPSGLAALAKALITDIVPFGIKDHAA